MSQATLLITGAANRIGAETCQLFHRSGFNIALHYRNSHEAAQQIADELNAIRAGSVLLLQAELSDTAQVEQLAESTLQHFGRIDVLINNASSFYPTPVDQMTEQQWDELFASNAKAPLFLAKACSPSLKAQQGCIINLIDIYAEQPLSDHPIYCMAKAANRAMVKSLAVELGPEVRVNGIAPGAIMWPEHDMAQSAQQTIIDATALKRSGQAHDIAETALFLASQAGYISGQIINVDGGRTLQC
ncbi:3-oxoacyl-[acyl-carrier-protein] reductase FabG [Sinobacterium norvegicum]|uniref:3-oxoacyl-[acyl-carrier-protein] reductase FabG n=1 Tax=Sinobacterium norvegicum TaxID=1641715 RepID=A0ABN8EL46_9GAMM|nr:pteridine reductase [Sinobacterium norvegicum]CAH0992112.1 3-oxoacyl-[acyl-carrier-protein] reductase FabG [Sinobacterium norvegicum]